MSKYCTKCGSVLEDSAKFCRKCGAEQEIKQENNANKKFCTYCGNEVNEHAVVCLNCGAGIKKEQNFSQNHYQHNDSYQKVKSPIDQAAQRIQINGIVWMAIGVIQLLLGLIFIDEMWFLLIVGVINIISSIKDLGYSKTLLENPVGLVKKVEPIVGPVITLIYNLLFGGVIGVAGSIYYFIGVRGFVLQNRGIFLEIEEEFLNDKYPGIV